MLCVGCPPSAQKEEGGGTFQERPKGSQEFVRREEPERMDSGESEAVLLAVAPKIKTPLGNCMTEDGIKSQKLKVKCKEE